MEPATNGHVVYMVFWIVFEVSRELFHNMDWNRSYHHTDYAPPLFLVLGAFALMKPTSLGRFMLFCGLALVNSFLSMPDLTNHQMLAVFINIGILASGACAVLSRHSRNPSLLAYEIYAPILRCSLIAFYFWVVVHKINVDYFSSEISCAWILYHDTIEKLASVTGGIIPSHTSTTMTLIVVWGTLACEALIPILLLFPRTRKAGILVGLAFHASLALYPSIYVGTFSLLMTSQYILFIPMSSLEKIVNAWMNSRTGRFFSERPWRVPAVIAACMAALFLLITIKTIGSGELNEHELRKYTHASSWYVCAGFVLIVMGILAWNLLTKSGGPWRKQEGTWLPRSHGFMVIIPALVFLNGLAPYLGLKNENCFAMYSNLRTEGGVNNHLFLPVVDILGTDEGGGVVVLASNDPAVPTKDEEYELFKRYRRHMSQQESSQKEFRPSWFTLRLLVDQTGPDFEITYMRDGAEPVTVSRRVNPDDPLFQAPNVFTRKIRSFKPVPPNDLPCTCRH